MDLLFVGDPSLLSLMRPWFRAETLTSQTQVEEASQPRDALGHLARQSFDVVLWDLSWCDRGGLDAIIEIALAYPSVSLVLLASHEEEELAIDALRHGAHDWLFEDELSKTNLTRVLRLAMERQRRAAAENQLLDSQLRERRRLSRELHDGVLQLLSSIRLQAQMLVAPESGHDSTISAGLAQVADLAFAAMDDIRRITQDLHPRVLDRDALGVAMTSTGRRIQRETGVEVHVVDQLDGEISLFAKHQLYRVFQEALRNAVTHGRAPRVQIRLETRDNHACLEIHDAGVGFDVAAADAAQKGLGLNSIRERVQSVDGFMRIDSRIGGGTHIAISIPAGRHFGMRRQDAYACDHAATLEPRDAELTIAATPRGRNRRMESRHVDQRHPG